MAGIVKTVVRFGVIAGLGTGAAVLIAGPERVGALAGAARQKAIACIDSQIDDPTILRAQLRELADKYPARIADVRGDLAELREQMAQIKRDSEVSSRVVALADADLLKLEPMLARAQSARQAAGSGQAVLVCFNDKDYSLEQAYNRATQIRQTKVAYQTRAADSERTYVYLQQQEERLAAVLAKLETEHADFQTQLWNMDHQVDAIARNDKLLEMIEKRQKEIDDSSRFDVVSVDQVQQRLAQIRAKQEAQFEALDKQAQSVGYEDIAQQQIRAEQAAKAEFERSLPPDATSPAAPIRIGPGENAETQDAGDQAQGSVASSLPVRIR